MIWFRVESAAIRTSTVHGWTPGRHATFTGGGDVLGYIDPQTGSMIWQGIVAAILGVGVAVKVFWKRITGFVTGRTRKERAASQTPDTTE